MIEIACLHCGLVNEDARDEGRCRLCGARLSQRQVDPMGEVTFGVDYKKLPLGRIVERSLFRLKGGERLKTQIRLWGVSTLRRSMGRPWVVPLFKGRVYRFRPISLTDQAPVDRKEVERLTEQFKPFGFESVMDRLIESAYAQPFQRLLIAKGRRLYATLTYTPGLPPAIGLWAPQGKEGMTLVTDTPYDLVVEPSLRIAFTPGASVQDMIATAESMTTVNDRSAAPLGVKELSIYLLNHHEQAIDAGLKEKRFRKMRTRRGRLIDDGIPPSCSTHRTIRATRECLVCGKPLCDLCVSQVAEGDFCADHLPDGSLPPGEPALDLTETVAPAGPLARSALAVGEPSFLLWGMSQIFPADGPVGSQIAALALMAPLFFLWFLYPLARWGATPMGRLFGVAVCDIHGGEPSWPAALVKTGGLFLALGTILPMVGFLPVFWDKHRRSWADRMAGVVTVTSHPKIKEALGLLLWAGMAIIVYERQAVIASGMERLFDGGLEKSRIALDEVWRLKTTQSAVRDGETLWLTDGARLGAINIADRAMIWATPLERHPDHIGLDRYGHAVAVTTGTTIQGYDTSRGTPTYRLTVATAPERAPLFLPRGLVVHTLHRIVCYERGGGTLWERTFETPVALSVNGGFLFVVRRGAVERLDNATGESQSVFEGYDHLAPYGDRGVLLSGEGRGALFSFAAGKTLWEKESALPTGAADLVAANLVALTDRMALGDDGSERYPFPDGHRFIGAGGKTVVVTDGRAVQMIDAVHGSLTGRIEGVEAERAEWLGTTADAGELFILRTGRGGEDKLFTVRLSPRTPPIATFRGTVPHEATLTAIGADKLLVTTTDAVGLYRLPR